MNYPLWTPEEEKKFFNKFNVSIWRVTSGRRIDSNKLRHELGRNYLTSGELDFIVSIASPRFENLNSELQTINGKRCNYQICVLDEGCNHFLLVEEMGYVNWPLATTKKGTTYAVTHLPTGYTLTHRAFGKYAKVKEFMDVAVRINGLEAVHTDENVQKEYLTLYREWIYK